MKKIFLSALAAVFALLLLNCGYRFVDPSPGAEYTLAETRNVTPEPGLDRMLAEELRNLGSFHPKSDNLLTVIVTAFEENVETVSSSGTVIRERLKLEVQWKVKSSGDARAVFGKETVTRSYPYSSDPVTLDWNRSGAIRLLLRSAAERVLDQLEVLP